MLITMCQKCKLALHVIGKDEELGELLEHPEWKRSYPCVAPLCSGRAMRIGAVPVDEVSELKTVPVEAYFRALHGFGLPDAPKPSTQLVKELLLEKGVADVIAYDTNEPERVIIECLVLTDGTRLHLASSSRGACIYHVETEAKNATSKRPVRNPEGGSPHREEVGRGAGGAKEGEPSTRDDAVPLQDSGVPSVPEAGGVHPGDQVGGDRPRDDSSVRLQSAADEAPA